MKLLSTLLISSLLLAGCDFEDSDDDDIIELYEDGVGFFIDSPVQGLSYSSASHSGTTDAFGRFDYEEGETITFSFGDITLPPISATKAIHVSDLYAAGLSDTQTINLARLLLTLDSDADSENGIQLSDDALDTTNTPDDLDFSSATFDADVANYIAAVAATSDSLDTLISAQDATEHITETKTEVEGLLAGCGNECVPRAAFNEHVISVTPRHSQTIDSSTSTMTIEFTSNLSFDIDEIELEMFELPSGTEDCRIDWSGLRCGDAGVDSYDLTTSLTRSTSADVNSGFIGKSEVNNKITFTLSGDSALVSNKLYVAHIFNDQEDGDDDDYKTWWLFYTE